MPRSQAAGVDAKDTDDAHHGEVATREVPEGDDHLNRIHADHQCGMATDGGPQRYSNREDVHIGDFHYPGCVTEMSLSDARARLADVVDSARVDHDPVFLTRRGRRVAAVIAAEDLDRLIAAAEDLADIRAAHDARQEMAGGEQPIPWAEVKADLGLS